MIFDVLTIFPGMFVSPMQESILGKALERNLVAIRLHNIRDHAADKHQMTDDRPFGGGEGMVMKPEPMVAALESVRADGPPPRVVLLTPQGQLFSQELARELARCPRVVLLCGRYEGVDERVARYFVDDELSLGDFILTGGELAAMVVIDVVTRLLPGVLGNAASAEAESFAEAILEYPQYTRPQVFRGHAVPEVLLSGNHQAIRNWRRGQALLRTQIRRPDLFARLELDPHDANLLAQARQEIFGETTGLGIARTDGPSSTISGAGTSPGGKSPP
jgi:tRNA (guanine37-N1)-methyltransferase